MYVFPPIKELPSQYHQLTMIRSVELKVKLAERIKEILELLDFFHTVEPNSQIKRRVDQFFQYLNNSCSGETDINHRALWLSKYSDVLRDQLLVIQNGSVVDYQIDTIVPDQAFLDLVDQLVVQSVAYHVQINDPMSVEAEIFLSDIISLSGKVKLGWQYTDYPDLHDQIKKLTVYFIEQAQMGARMRTHNTYVTGQLRHICFQLNRLVFHRSINR